VVAAGAGHAVQLVDWIIGDTLIIQFKEDSASDAVSMPLPAHMRRVGQQATQVCSEPRHRRDVQAPCLNSATDLIQRLSCYNDTNDTVESCL